MACGILLSSYVICPNLGLFFPNVQQGLLRYNGLGLAVFILKIGFIKYKAEINTS